MLSYEEMNMHHKELEYDELQRKLNKVSPGSVLKVSKKELEMLDKCTTYNLDVVNKPTHYNQYGIEALDAIQASMEPIEFKGYLKGNIEKYIWRYNYKGKPLEDLKKAQYYLNKLIQEVENDKS